MSTPPGPWYLCGQGKEPSGPFSPDELLESWRADRLDANTLCWREGMSQWLPLAQVELFASAMAPAGPPWQAAAAAAQSPLPPVVVPPPVQTAAPPGKEQRLPAAWIGWAIGGGIAFALALAACIFVLTGSRMPAALRYMPDGSKAFLSVDVAALRDGKLYHDFVQAAGTSIDAADRNLKNELGVALADISRVSLGFDLDASQEPSRLVAVIELQTPYTPDRVPRKLKQESLGDFKVYKAEPGDVAMYIAGKQTLVLAEPKLLEDVLERNASPKLSTALESAIKEAAADRSRTLYLAAIPPEKLPSLPGSPPLSTETINDIEAATLSATLADELSARLKVTCKHENAAEKIEKQVNGLLAPAGQIEAIPAELKQILASVKVARSGVTVTAEAHGVGERLVASLALPAVQAAREAVRRAAHQDDLKQPGPNQALGGSPPRFPGPPQRPAETRALPLAPTTATQPRQDNVPAYVAPPGLTEGIDRLLQRLQQHHELIGELGDYKVFVPPDYTGDETEYEVGLLCPPSSFYAFRTADGGKTWSRLNPTNLYLNAMQQAARKARSGQRGAQQPTLGAAVRRPSQQSDDSAADSRAKGPLSGAWLTSTGDQIRIVDDGTTITVDLVSHDRRKTFSGRLSRGDKGPEAKSLTGLVTAIIPTDAPRRHILHVTATIDEAGKVHLRCADWPKWSKAGKMIGTRTRTLTLTRLGGVPAPSGGQKRAPAPASAPDESD